MNDKGLELVEAVFRLSRQMYGDSKHWRTKQMLFYHWQNLRGCGIGATASTVRMIAKGCLSGSDAGMMLRYIWENFRSFIKWPFQSARFDLPSPQSQISLFGGISPTSSLQPIPSAFTRNTPWYCPGGILKISLSVVFLWNDKWRIYPLWEFSEVLDPFMSIRGLSPVHITNECLLCINIHSRSAR